MIEHRKLEKYSDIFLDKLIYHSSYGIGRILKIESNCEFVYFYIDFSEKQIKINHRGLGKYYFIIDNLQNVEKVKSYFGDEIIIKVKFTTNTYEEKKTTQEEKKLNNNEKYISNCYRCGKTVHDGFKKCNRCGWYICKCGACGCGFTKRYRY